MTTQPATRPHLARLIRPMAWSLVAGLLLLPLIAMQFTDEVVWNAEDFIVAGILLIGPGLVMELVVWRSGSLAYRLGATLGLALAVLLIWVNGAVGIINSENDPANLMFGAVLLVALIGALIARFHARGLAHALAATALAQVAVGAIALFAGWGVDDRPGLVAVVGSTVVFSLGWAAAAALFWKAAHD